MVHCQLIATYYQFLLVCLPSPFIWPEMAPKLLEPQMGGGLLQKKSPRLGQRSPWFCWILPRSSYDLEQETPSGLGVFSRVWTQGARKAEDSPQDLLPHSSEIYPGGLAQEVGGPPEENSSLQILLCPSFAFQPRNSQREKKRGNKLGVVTHACRKSEEGCCELKASLGYLVSSR